MIVPPSAVDDEVHVGLRGRRRPRRGPRRRNTPQVSQVPQDGAHARPMALRPRPLHRSVYWESVRIYHSGSDSEETARIPHTTIQPPTITPSAMLSSQTLVCSPLGVKPKVWRFQNLPVARQ